VNVAKSRNCEVFWNGYFLTNLDKVSSVDQLEQTNQKILYTTGHFLTVFEFIAVRFKKPQPKKKKNQKLKNI